MSSQNAPLGYLVSSKISKAPFENVYYLTNISNITNLTKLTILTTAFCMDSLKEDYNNKISKKELRKKYFNYCRKYKLRSASDKSIKITLENMFGCIETRLIDTSFGWEGVKFKDCKDCKGFSTYRVNDNSPIGSNILTKVTNGEKRDEIQTIKQEVLK